MSLLRIENLTKRFQFEETEVTVIEDVSFEVNKREFVCLVGPSGCGKSTILKIVTGLSKPSAGRVVYAESDVKEVGSDVAMIFQSFALFPWLTVRQNVSLGLEAQGRERQEYEATADHYLDKVGLDGQEEAYPRELSGGMKQRVGIARALAVEPELLCMDEPFSALDALTAMNLREEVIDLWQDESIPVQAVLMVTHSIEEAVFMADRIVVMSTHPGRIIAQIEVALERPRNMKESRLQRITDDIYSLIIQQRHKEEQ